MATLTEPLQNDTPTVLPSEPEPEPELPPEPEQELPEPEPELPPGLAELPEFRLLAEMLGRLALLQHLPLCIEHEFDMDTLMVCDAADLVDIGLPPHAVDVITAEIKTLRGVRTNAVDEADDQGPQDPVEEAATTYSAAQIAEWDDDTAAAWLQTVDLGGGVELAAMLSVELDGDDLAKVNDSSLELLCKKAAKKKQYRDLDWAAMRRAVIAARDRAVGMGQMERVGPELLYDRSRLLGSAGCQVCSHRWWSRSHDFPSVFFTQNGCRMKESESSEADARHCRRRQVWVGQLGDGRPCAVKQVDTLQGQKEHALLLRVRVVVGGSVIQCRSQAKRAQSYIRL